MTQADAFRILEIDDVELHLDMVRLRVDGRQVPITLQEFRVLEVLMNADGKVISKDDLLDRAWGDRLGRRSNTLAVLISRLRAKLKRPDGTSRIRTVRALGYAFAVSGDSNDVLDH